MRTFAPVCGQCGKSHPPLQPGEVCPCAVVRLEDNKEVDFNELFVPLRTILKSQIETKKIKDIKKLFGQILVSITKVIEGYEEK